MKLLRLFEYFLFLMFLTDFEAVVRARICVYQGRDS